MSTTSGNRTSSSRAGTPELPGQETLGRIIQQGDARLLVVQAEAIGNWLAGAGLTTNQLRNVFTTVREIETNWPIVRHTRLGENQLPEAQHQRAQQRAKASARQLLLLKPKLAYQASREQRGSGMRYLSQLLAPAIDMVGDNRGYFGNLVDFVEAIVAYHTAGSREKRR